MKKQTILTAVMIVLLCPFLLATTYYYRNQKIHPIPPDSKIQILTKPQF